MVHHEIDDSAGQDDDQHEPQEDFLLHASIVRPPDANRKVFSGNDLRNGDARGRVKRQETSFLSFAWSDSRKGIAP